MQYADYAIWQRQLLGDASDEGSVMAAQLGYWRAQLAGLPGGLELPADRVRPAVVSYAGGRVGWRVPASVRAGLAELARAQDATMFMVALAATGLLLARLGAGDDIPVGTPVAGRPDEAMSGLVGFFVNTLVLRTRVAAADSFTALLAGARRPRWARMRIRMCRSSTWSMTCARNSPCPATRCSRSCSHSRTTPARTWTCPARPSASARQHRSHQVRPSIQLVGNPRPKRVGWAGRRGRLPRDLFSAGAAGLVAGRLVRVLEQVAADPGLRVYQVSLLSDGERAELAARNRTGALVPDDTVAGLFAGRARRVPDAVAVTDGDAVVSYRFLAAAAARLGARLAGVGAGPESVVAVMVPRSVGMVTAVLGVLWAGAAYLPLDAGYPPERISFMLTNAGAVALVCTAAVGQSAGPASLPRVLLDAPGTAAAAAAGRGSSSPVRVRPGGVGLCDVHLGVYRDAQGRGGHSWRGGGAGGVGGRAVRAGRGVEPGAGVDVAEFRRVGVRVAGPAVRGGLRISRAGSAGAGGPGWRGCRGVAGQRGAVGADAGAGCYGRLAGPAMVVLAGEALTAATLGAVRAAVPGASLANIYGPD